MKKTAILVPDFPEFLPVRAEDVRVGDVLTNSSKTVRMIIRSCYQMAYSRRVVFGWSYTELITGEIDRAVYESPVFYADELIRLVKQEVTGWNPHRLLLNEHTDNLIARTNPLVAKRGRDTVRHVLEMITKRY